MEVYLQNTKLNKCKMKAIVKRLINSLGYEITRKRTIPKTVYGKQLSYYETSTGNYFLPREANADVVANTIRQNDIFDKEIINIASKYVKKGSIVLDVGANFGQMSILFSNMVGENGQVYSFDADDFVFEILKKNINANNKNNITPIFGAVHDVEGQVLHFPVQNFEEFSTYGSYGIDYNANHGREVKSVTIDSLNIETAISFMKIDIQGGDLNAMKGAINTINKNRMPIIFEYEYLFEDKYELCFQDYIDFVRSINYKFVKVINGHNYLIMPQ